MGSSSPRFRGALDEQRTEEANRSRRRRGPRPRVPGLRRALAAAVPASGKLPLRVLLPALPARISLPELRRALDDRPHARHGAVALRAMRGLHVEAGLATGRLNPRELIRSTLVEPSI